MGGWLIFCLCVLGWLLIGFLSILWVNYMRFQDVAPGYDDSQDGLPLSVAMALIALGPGSTLLFWYLATENVNSKLYFGFRLKNLIEK